jgi:oxygen-independent coproporphyrinogen III oxidase
MRVSKSLSHLIRDSTPYVAYAYAYPHKTAYRAITPRPISEVWAGERRDQLFLYLHIPFCEMRCGFCNLFTTANPKQDVIDAYVRSLIREAKIVRRELGEQANISRLAIGGGTPTFIDSHHLEQIVSALQNVFGVEPGSIPMSVETSPRTATREKLAVLSGFGVERISMGVQSFVASEIAASGRSQKDTWVESAVTLVRELRFPTLNLDLIYGLPGQTVESWMYSIEAALAFDPEELFLYPLYVRPLTGLERRGARVDDDIRLDCYRAGRDRLLSAGYEQVSMRMFRKADRAGRESPYCCQDDGMIGLGCGARSYTRALHYSSEYAVGSAGVREIIDRYVHRSDESMSLVDYGCELSDVEQRRRWIIKSLFHRSGLDVVRYERVFGSLPTDDFPIVARLIDEGYHAIDKGIIAPTDLGLEWSDALAPALFSEVMQVKSNAYQFR